MKKNKPQKIGIRPEWIRQYITIPLIKIALCIALIYGVVFHIQGYAKNKAEEEKQKIEIQASISAEESIIAESKRSKAQLIAEEEAKKESLSKIEIETRKTNTLYENQVSKKVCPIGTYLKNSKLKKVGRVIGYYGLEVITNNEWQFNLDSNGVYPDYINIIGYSEYTKSLQKQKEIAEKKYQQENADRIQKIIEKDIAELTKDTKEKLNTPYIKLGNELYRVWEVKGDQLYCTKKGMRKKKNNYIQITYSNLIECIDYTTYEVSK